MIVAPLASCWSAFLLVRILRFCSHHMWRGWHIVTSGVEKNPLRLHCHGRRETPARTCKDAVKRTGAHRPLLAPLSQCPPPPHTHTFNLPVPSIFNKYTHLISKARGCSNDAHQVGHAGAKERSPARNPVSLTVS